MVEFIVSHFSITIDIWSGSRTSQTQDRLATAKLIEILKNYQARGELFTNRKMRKKEIWVDIASQLMAEGFHFRNKETAWEKVSQKWRNMERTYRMNITSIRKKGISEPYRTMEFFDDLHELLAGKYHTESVLSESNDMCYLNQSEGEDNHSMMMTNGDYEYEEEQGDEHLVTGETGTSLEEIEQEEICYETYVEEEFSPSPTFSDNKNLVFSNQETSIPYDPHTAGVRDPVVRLLLEMRAQERAHFREDRRERLNMLRETNEFRRELMEMLNQQHQERMEAMNNLIAAISGALSKNSTSSASKDGAEGKLNCIVNGDSDPAQC